MGEARRRRSRPLIFWRIQHAKDPISAGHRSRIGSEDDEIDLGYEAGTSACSTFADLQRWAQGGHANWIGLVAIVEFTAEPLGYGMDGETVVRPLKELHRWTFQAGREHPSVSAVLKSLTLRKLRASEDD